MKKEKNELFPTKKGKKIPQYSRHVLSDVMNHEPEEALLRLQTARAISKVTKKKGNRKKMKKMDIKRKPSN